MHRLCHFIRAIVMAVALMATPVWGATPTTPGDIGDYGTWMTEHNAAAFTQNLSHDMAAFSGSIQDSYRTPGFVPPEARIGLAFVGAMSLIGEILESSLVRFMIMFIIIAYAFWIMFDTYQMMRDGQKAWDLVQKIFTRGILITVWIMILNVGPARLFVWIVTPIVMFGSYMADLILGAVTQTAGVTLPDTCAAVHQYVVANAGDGLILDAGTAADLMCLPTRITGFFYTAIATGWRWMIGGIGHSVTGFVVGAAMVFVFVFNIWKFTLMALGVIAELFLALFMLPFTAVAETVTKTNYKGIAGDIFNGFMGIFKSENLTTQLGRFIDASIYFISLAMVVAVAAALMGFVIQIDGNGMPIINQGDGMVALLVGFLAAYMVTRAEKLATDLGGSVKENISKQVGGDLKKLWDTTRKGWKNLRGIGGGKK